MACLRYSPTDQVVGAASSAAEACDRTELSQVEACPWEVDSACALVVGEVDLPCPTCHPSNEVEWTDPTH